MKETTLSAIILFVTENDLAIKFFSPICRPTGENI